MAEEIKEFMEIGGSPVPGITLRQVLRGRNGNIGELKWSSNGEILASASTDGTICFWSPEHNSPIKTITAPGRQFSVDWAPNDRLLAAAGDSKIITIFNTLTGDQYRTLEGHDDGSICLAWSPNNNFLASGSNDCTIRIWDIEKGQTQRILLGHDKNVLCLAWSPDGHLIASGSPDGTIRLWNPEGDSLLHFKFSNEYIYDIAWMPNSKALAAGTTENRIHIVDIDHKRITAVIEGHTHSIESVAFSRNMPLLASQSFDHTVRFWSTDKWKQIAVFNEITSGALHTGGLSFNPLANIFASRGNSEMTIRIWDIDYEILIHNRPINKSVHYTTAKLVLVGDSGVGKTGLGWRLAHNEFKEHSSTHGQQFWVVPELKKTRVDGTECEAVLWDLAGQPDYRLVHSLYLDDVDTALVLFDPTNRQEPLAGVDFWLNQLKDKDKKLRNAILVGARTDRGTSTLTDAEIKAYCERNGVSGGYIPTSALDGNGLPELLEKLKE